MPKVMEKLGIYINFLIDNQEMLQNNGYLSKLVEQISEIFYGLTSVGSGISREKAFVDIAENLAYMYDIHLLPETVEELKQMRLESAYRTIGHYILQDLKSKFQDEVISKTI